MKKFILWLAIVVVILIGADVLFGVFSNHFLSPGHLKGDYESQDYIIRNSRDKILVLGSSVALNSFDAKRMSDSLGTSVFNGGANGQTFTYYYTIFKTIAARSGLKTLIVGLNEYNLIDSGAGNRFSLLVPYYNRGYKEIDKGLESMSPANKALLKSSLYRYNTIWWRILLYNFITPDEKHSNGFVSKGIPSFFPKRAKGIAGNVSAERMAQVRDMEKICREKGIRLIFALTPRYQNAGPNKSVESFLRGEEALGKLELWHDVVSTPISADSSMFYDETHLNINGAEKYTDLIIQRLKNEK